MAATDDSGDLLYELACECEGLFDARLASLKAQKSPLSDLAAEYQQRFAIWAAQLGVFARKSQSLDTRLRNHGDIQDLVARLLDILRRSLLQLENAAPSGEALSAVDAVLRRLNRLGATIRQSSRGRIDVKVQQFAASLDLRPFAAVSQAVVQQLYPNSHHSLQHYLAKTMVDRYAAMLFAKHREGKLQSRRSAKPVGFMPTIDESTNHVPEGQLMKVVIHQKLSSKPLVGSAALAKRPSAASHSDLSTVNSKQLRLALRTTNNFLAPTEKRKGTSSVQVGQGNYPRVPFQKESNLVTCEWCGKIMEKQDMNDSDWRRHIDEDLKPYVCISDACSDGHPAFPSFAPWLCHMKQHNRRWHQRVFPTSCWICAVCDDSHDTHANPEALHGHLVQAHEDTFSARQLQAIARQSKVERPRPWNECLLCCFTVDETEPPPKRQKERVDEASNKSSRTDFDMKHPKSMRDEEERDSDDSDSSSRDAAEGNQSPPESAETMARHVASHLQVLMLLTIRLASLQDEDHDPDADNDNANSDSVDAGDSDDASLTKLARSARGSWGDRTSAATAEDVELPDADEEPRETIDLPQDDLAIPDAVFDLDGVPRQHDQLSAENDGFLQELIKSGAYQAHLQVPDEEGTNEDRQLPWQLGWGATATIMPSESESGSEIESDNSSWKTDEAMIDAEPNVPATVEEAHEAVSEYFVVRLEKTSQEVRVDDASGGMMRTPIWKRAFIVDEARGSASKHAVARKVRDLDQNTISVRFKMEGLSDDARYQVNLALEYLQNKFDNDSLHTTLVQLKSRNQRERTWRGNDKHPSDAPPKEGDTERVNPEHDVITAYFKQVPRPGVNPFLLLQDQQADQQLLYNSFNGLSETDAGGGDEDMSVGDNDDKAVGPRVIYTGKRASPVKSTYTGVERVRSRRDRFERELVRDAIDGDGDLSGSDNNAVNTRGTYYRNRGAIIESASGGGNGGPSRRYRLEEEAPERDAGGGDGGRRSGRTNRPAKARGAYHGDRGSILVVEGALYGADEGRSRRRRVEMELERDAAARSDRSLSGRDSDSVRPPNSNYGGQDMIIESASRRENEVRSDRDYYSNLRDTHARVHREIIESISSGGNEGRSRRSASERRYRGNDEGRVRRDFDRPGEQPPLVLADELRRSRRDRFEREAVVVASGNSRRDPEYRRRNNDESARASESPDAMDADDHRDTSPSTPVHESILYSPEESQRQFSGPSLYMAPRQPSPLYSRHGHPTVIQPQRSRSARPSTRAPTDEQTPVVPERIIR